MDGQTSAHNTPGAPITFAVDAAGYSAETTAIDLDITGMTCSDCAAGHQKEYRLKEYRHERARCGGSQRAAGEDGSLL